MNRRDHMGPLILRSAIVAAPVLHESKQHHRAGLRRNDAGCDDPATHEHPSGAASSGCRHILAPDNGADLAHLEQPGREPAARPRRRGPSARDRQLGALPAALRGAGARPPGLGTLRAAWHRPLARHAAVAALPDRLWRGDDRARCASAGDQRALPLPVPRSDAQRRRRNAPGALTGRRDARGDLPCGRGSRPSVGVRLAPADGTIRIVDAAAPPSTASAPSEVTDH